MGILTKKLSINCNRRVHNILLVYWSNLHFSGLFICQGNSWPQLSCQEHLKGQNIKTKIHKNKRMIFKGTVLLTHFFYSLQKFKLFLTSHMSGYLVKPMRGDEDRNGAARSFGVILASRKPSEPILWYKSGSIRF